MRDLDLEGGLKFLNYVLGTVIVLLSLFLYLKKGSRVPAYITLAIITAGPLEDVLTAMIKHDQNLSSKKKKKYLTLVDQLTSIGFLTFLLLAILASAS